MTEPDDRHATKRDRLARLLRVVAVLRGHPDGIRPSEIARRIDVSPRTVYRDLKALDEEVGVTVWAENGLWGLSNDDFLPPLKLTLSEAMAVVLSARLMVRQADKYDPDLASAFEKLAAALPDTLREHVSRSLDVLQDAPLDTDFIAHVRDLTRAWAERRTVEIEYEGAAYEGRPGDRSRRTVRPFLIEPSLQTHALYLIGWDETRDAVRTFKVERIRDVALTPRTFDPPPAGAIDTAFKAAWDIIADQPEVEVVLRFGADVAARVQEATWHPNQRVHVADDGSLEWRALVSGTIEIRLWILQWGSDVEVLAPQDLRDDVAATLRRAVAQYGAG